MSLLAKTHVRVGRGRGDKPSSLVSFIVVESMVLNLLSVRATDAVWPIQSQYGLSLVSIWFLHGRAPTKKKGGHSRGQGGTGVMASIIGVTVVRRCH